jgi:hypothetical protein
LTDPGDVVVDIFGGSMTTGWAAKRTGRRWIGMELEQEYVRTSRYRFVDDDGALLPDDHRVDAPLVPVMGSAPASPTALEDASDDEPRDRDFEDLSIRPAG